MIPRRDVFVQYRVVNGIKYIAKNYKAFQLDEVGELVWDSIDGKTSIEQIADKIAEKYNVDKAMVLKDIQQFMKELLENELVEV
ncbi:MAG: hypothetical protein HPY66_2274 [Firmicutes bacterium]|nr:hypothetical protein [Bacillota bacterium]